ncbi:hypothetical protein CsSME_00040604 [Camellia sinensis var. sinensis]
MKAQTEVSVPSNEIESLIDKLSTCEIDRTQLRHAHDELKEKNGVFMTCSKSKKEFEANITSLELELKSVKASSAQCVDATLSTQHMIKEKGGVGIITGRGVRSAVRAV